MSFLRILKDVTNRQLYLGEQIHIVPRGLIYPVDFGGLGKIRFGKKVGSQLPLLTPDNSYELVEDAIYLSDKLVVDRDPIWIDVGSYVYVSERELHKVDDVVEDTIYLETRLLADHIEGQQIFHYSSPIMIEGNFDVGQDVIVVDSTTFMVRGDVIAIPKTTVGEDITITTFVEYQIVEILASSVSGDIYQYQIALNKRISVDLDDGTIIQLKANLAYQSNIRTVPSTGGFQRRISGPFLVDWVSAPLRNEMELDETQTIYLYTTARALIDDPRVIEKNHAILREPIRPDQFMFWTKAAGSINYDDALKRFVMIPNSEGRWELVHHCAPFIDPPSKSASGGIVTVELSLLNNNEGFTIDDSEDTVIFEYQVNGAYAVTPSSAATGSISVGTMPINNQWFTIDDGFGNSLQCEFKVTTPFTSTDNYYTVDVTSAVIPTDVAILIQEFLNDILGFQILASVAGTLVNLNHDHISTRGNQTIVLDPTLLIGPFFWSSTGMSGGTDAVKTIDIQTATTDIKVAEFTSAAINSKVMHVKSDWPTLVPSLLLTTDLEGTVGNIPIIKTVANPGFSITGMGGGSGGMRWTTTLKSTTDALFRIRFYPNDWHDYNLVGGVESAINIVIDANDDPITMIDMIIKSDPASEVLMGEWALTGPRVGAIKYEYVARLYGSYNFASTTLLLKQLWQSIDDVASVHDAGFALDSGYVKADNP